MNTVLSDYSNISNLELNKRASYYDRLEFYRDLIDLKIPDVDGYVKKIFNCLRWAEQSRIIIEDICKQIIEYRLANKQIVNSVEYKLGTIGVDGRAYIQQNVHLYCQYISEINDCLCQILNIVYDIGKRPWDKFDGNFVIEHNNLKDHSGIVQLCKKFYSEICCYLDFDNYAKHNLILWGREKLSPESIFNVEYYFDMYDKQYKMSDFINISQERIIKTLVVELLDKVFDSIRTNKFCKRKYVRANVDFNISENSVVTYNDRFLSESDIITIHITTKERSDGLIQAERISYNCIEDTIPQVLFLVRMDRQPIAPEMIQYILGTIAFNKFDVWQNGKKVGEYICSNKKDRTAKYFHFKKFEYKKCE